MRGNLTVTKKPFLKAMLLTAILFALLASLGFFVGLMLYGKINAIPPQMKEAMNALLGILPAVAVGSLILGALQGVLNVYAYRHHKKRIIWLINLVLALVAGFLASFKGEIWTIWALVSMLNLLTIWTVMQLVAK